MDRVSVVIPGRHEEYFNRTVEGILENATGDIEIIAVQDGDNAYPITVKDNRVKVIVLEESIGQRAAYNLGVRESTGKYVMKLDAHALPSKGFDEILKSYCPPKTTILPEMRRLDHRKWESKKRGKTHFMFFGIDLYCHYWKGYGKRPEAKEEYPEVFTGQGSCWFCTREWNDYIGLLDEGVGSWGKVGIEVSLRTWLCGGRQILNKNAWQAHWFRVSEGGFPYPFSGRQVAKAHSYTWENYFFKDTGAFKNQVRSFAWLINKFAPVPTWEAFLVDEYKAPRAIVIDPVDGIEESLRKAALARLRTTAGPIPILKDEDSIKELSEDTVVYLCGDDTFYHPSHFAYIPKDKDAIYFNENLFQLVPGQAAFHKKGTDCLSHPIAYRNAIIDFPDNKDLRILLISSERPNVEIVQDPDRLQGKGVFNLPGWGGPSHFQTTVKYKGTMRYDIIKFLIELYGYQSYLEIGVDKGKSFHEISCPVKDGVDPKGNCNYPITSDEFWKSPPRTYDLIFIDGLHEAEQVKRDIRGALSILNSSGVIVMHDCSPRNEKEQQVPKDPKQRIWTGDVWKAFVFFRVHPHLEMYVVDTNNGIGIIRQGSQDPIITHEPNYLEFERNRINWLNLKTVSEFRKYERDRKCFAETVSGVTLTTNPSKNLKTPDSVIAENINPSPLDKMEDTGASGQSLTQKITAGNGGKPLKRHEPVPVEDMFKKNGRTNTICQTLREIYWATDNETIQVRLREAVAMAKAMDARLKKYKRKWDKKFWDRRQ